MRPLGRFDHDDFDKDFDRWFKRLGVAAVVYGVLILAFWGLVIFAALHFLLKVW